MAKVAYIRVSTVEQNEERQLDAMSKYKIDRYFSEKVSAKIRTDHFYKRCCVMSVKMIRYMCMISAVWQGLLWIYWVLWSNCKERCTSCFFERKHWYKYTHRKAYAPDDSSYQWIWTCKPIRKAEGRHCSS